MVKYFASFYIHHIASRQYSLVGKITEFVGEGNLPAFKSQLYHILDLEP